MSKGVVFFTILKAGFMFSGKYGTGFVVTKLPGGQWSAPSALTVRDILMPIHLLMNLSVQVEWFRLGSSVRRRAYGCNAFPVY
jgi:hypothetical protein